MITDMSIVTAVKLSRIAQKQYMMLILLDIIKLVLTSTCKKIYLAIQKIYIIIISASLSWYQFSGII